MSSYRKVTYLIGHGIARITLNRPERRNALDQEMLTELRDALDPVTANAPIDIP